MFENLGLSEILIIVIVALIIFGPKRLPELGKGLGKAIREFKSATRDAKEQLVESVRAEDDEKKAAGPGQA